MYHFQINSEAAKDGDENETKQVPLKGHGIMETCLTQIIYFDIITINLPKILSTN